MDSQQCMWFSRLSFGVSLVALVTALVGGGCQSAPDVGPEQNAAQPAEDSVGSGPDTAKVADVPAKAERQAPAKEPARPTSAEAPEAADEAEQPSDETAKADKPKDETAKTEKPEPASEPLEVKRLVVTHAIEGREPVAVDQLTTGEQPVVAFVELKNPADQAQKLQVTFQPAEGGEKVGFIDLEVPAKSPRWRTWGNTQRVTKAGKWVAIVSDEGGAELSRTEFEVSEGATVPVSEGEGGEKAPQATASAK